MDIRRATSADRAILLDLWLRSVRATHAFVQEDDFQAMIPQVRACLESSEPEFWVLCDESGALLGFMGMRGNNMESLFIAPEYLRRGAGRSWMNKAARIHCCACGWRGAKAQMAATEAFPVPVLAALGLLVTACAHSPATGPDYGDAPPGWKLVYRHAADGNPIAGSKAELLSAVRSGAPIRFACGTMIERDGTVLSVEHSAEPVFLTIVNGAEVVVQLPEHIAQRSCVDPVNPGFDDPAVMWRGLMSTNGTFDAVWVNRATGVEIRRYLQRVGLAWFGLKAGTPAAQAPLELAVPGGVRRAEGASE